MGLGCYVVVDSLFIVGPVVCGGFMFGPCFFFYNEVVSVFSSFEVILQDSWLLYFNCLPTVLWLLVYCVFS